MSVVLLAAHPAHPALPLQPAVLATPVLANDSFVEISATGLQFGGADDAEETSPTTFAVEKQNYPPRPRS